MVDCLLALLLYAIMYFIVSCKKSSSGEEPGFGFGGGGGGGQPSDTSLKQMYKAFKKLTTFNHELNF